jgi:hypothetical protein
LLAIRTGGAFKTAPIPGASIILRLTNLVMLRSPWCRREHYRTPSHRRLALADDVANLVLVDVYYKGGAMPHCEALGCGLLVSTLNRLALDATAAALGTVTHRIYGPDPLLLSRRPSSTRTESEPMRLSEDIEKFRVTLAAGRLSD